MNIRKYGGDSERKYDSLKEELERKISSIGGLGKLRESLSARGEDRQGMQKSQGPKKDNINEDSSTILEENEEKESVISIEGGPNLEDMELVQGEQSEAIKDIGEEKPDEVLQESKTDEKEMAILGGGGNVEMPPDTEMQVEAVNNVPNARNGGKEVEVLQDLSILEYIVVNKAKGRILKNADVLSVQERDVSQIGETDEIRELFMAFSKNAPKSKNEKEIADRNEFKEEWK